jgi:NADPH:quinone reductase-like Zn-dependent oxidoreductase
MQSTQVYAITRDPGPGAIEARTTDIPEPGAGQVRVRVETAGVSYGDLLFQRGVVPGGPKIPFVPGCDLTGTVDSVGAGVSGLEPGQRVTALVVSGGYTSLVNLPAERVVPVPDGLDPVDVAAVTLNYFIAHQMLHRVAKVTPGQRILVHGGSGGVGLALLQLAEQIGDVTAWGSASARNADIVRQAGGIPIDYRAEDFINVVRAGGGNLNAVFDPIGGGHFWRSYAVLGKGGSLVAYGQSDALRDGKRNMLVGALGFLGGIVLPKLVPDGRKTGFYNAWSLEKSQPQAYREDLSEVLNLRLANKIAPRSITLLPLREAEKAFEALEEGVSGKIVLDARGLS